MGSMNIRGKARSTLGKLASFVSTQQPFHLPVDGRQLAHLLLIMLFRQASRGGHCLGLQLTDLGCHQGLPYSRGGGGLRGAVTVAEVAVELGQEGRDNILALWGDRGWGGLGTGGGDGFWKGSSSRIHTTGSFQNL